MTDVMWSTAIETKHQITNTHSMHVRVCMCAHRAWISNGLHCKWNAKVMFKLVDQECDELQIFMAVFLVCESTAQHNQSLSPSPHLSHHPTSSFIVNAIYPFPAISISEKNVLNHFVNVSEQMND